MADDGKELLVNLKFTTETGAISTAANKLDQLREKQRKGEKDTAEDVKKAHASSITDAERLTKVGAAMSLAFGAASAAMMLSAKNYVSAVSTSEETSRRWLGANKEIEKAQLRIGRVFATELTPYMEKGAYLMEKFADFSEKNPGFVSAATKIVGGGAILGTTAFTAAKAIQTLQGLGSVLGLTGAAAAGGAAVSGAAGTAGAGAAGTAAAGAAGATAAGAMVAGGGGILAGFGINELLANSNLEKLLEKGGNKLNINNPLTGKPLELGFANGNEILTALVYKLGELVGGKTTAMDWGKNVAVMSGAVDNKSAGLVKPVEFSDQQVQAYYNYQRQEQMAERQRYLQLFRMQRDFNRSILIEDQDFTKNRKRALRDYHREETIAEQDYYRQRSIRARDYGIEIVRAEEDHQRSMKRAQEDYQFELWDILRSGDALAYMKATRSYNLSRSRSEEDYQIEMKRKSEDYAREVADQEREFEISRKRRQQQFQIQLKDEDEDFAIRRKRTLEQYSIQLADMQRDFDEQRLYRRQSLLDQIRDLYQGEEQIRRLRAEFTQASIADLRAAISQVESGNTNIINGSRATGGYVMDGLYRMHDQEWVMNRDLTSYAEQMTGGRLTDDAMLGLISGKGGRGSGTVVWNDYRKFDSRLTAEDRRMITQDTYAILDEVING